MLFKCKMMKLTKISGKITVGTMKQKTSQELMKEFDARAERIIKEMEEISRRSALRRMILLKTKEDREETKHEDY